MSGRARFIFFKPIFFALSKIFQLIPKPLRRIIWSLSSVFSGSIACGFRYVILKTEAPYVGDNIYIGEYVVIRHSENLEVGSNVSIHPFCYIEALGGCKIGHNVSIAHNVSILTTNHSWQDESTPIKYNPMIYESIIIEDDVWIGCGVRILPGIRIGKRSIIAAGSVVTNDVISNTLVAGIPAKIIKNI